MKARLNVVSYKNTPPETPISAEFGEQGGTIGRAAGNTCSLPDPERFISGKHAEVSFDDGRFYITDTSTNGLYFEGNINPVGRDNRVVLNDHSRLVLGDYLLEVRIEENSASTAHSPFGTPESSLSADFFDTTQEEITTPTAPETSLSENNLTGNKLTKNNPAEDLLQQPLKPTTPPWQSVQETKAKSDKFFSTPEEQEKSDTNTAGKTNNDFFDPAPTSNKTSEFRGAAEPDNVPADSQFFNAPNSIPEDWDILADEEPPITPAQEPSFNQPAPAPEQTPQAGAQPTPEPLSPKPESQDLQAPDLQNSRDFAIPTPGSARARPAPAVRASVTTSDTTTAFLHGAGIERLALPDGQEQQAMQDAGALMRAAIEGLMQMLRARAEIKSEFRMQQTTIRAAENNPLKFSVTVEDALQHMLLYSNSAYLPPMEAMQEAMEDLEAHQLATMAGVQAALSAMLQRFNPEQLRNQFEQKSGRSLLESKKAWYWEQYETNYQQILNDAEDQFQELFGEAFTKAYQEQIERLLSSRNPQK